MQTIVLHPDDAEMVLLAFGFRPSALSVGLTLKDCQLQRIGDYVYATGDNLKLKQLLGDISKHGCG